ncbi:DUF3300 domain-containing protein [Paraburkholderia sp. CNPSo 3157]|uniref:DUF3300 domain-containing protein n=2 Tax=Paraburkholderia franconis TaxID=2654983 RepID=A0A7X1NA05_9BURK|nr:DUF3300 domain-containing protein [Paraburkholderia franconis]MPW18159.1 DUF3300 domain-containing protein [Paraburkholderia franconis]
MTNWIARFLSAGLVVLLAGCPAKQQNQQTQTQAASAPAPASVPATASVPPAASAPAPASVVQTQAQQLASEEIEALVAPIALYPDSLLSQVLMASTYPLEVVHAARWVKAHRNLKGDAAVKAVENQPWDVSVKSLVAFPQVLEPMNDKLDWTQKLGDAFLASQKDVLDAVQRLRIRAQQAGNLTSNAQQKVIVEAPAPGGNGGQAAHASQTIVRIEPSDPQVVYVPSYNPTVAYGGWSAPAYPPTYWPPYPAYYPGAALASGFAWGLGIAAAGAIFSNCDWNNNNVNVNVNKAANIDRNFDRTKVEGGKWQHDAGHRQGVAYRDNATRDKYARGAQGANARSDYRGRSGSAPERTSLANRARGGNQAAGNRTGRATNAKAANRTGGTKTAGAGNRAGKSSREAAAGSRAQTANRNAAAGNRAEMPNRSASAGNRARTSAPAGATGAQTSYRSGGYSGGGRDTAFQGVGAGGASQRDYNRGRASAQSSNFNPGSGVARGGGGGGSRGGRR